MERQSVISFILSVLILRDFLNFILWEFLKNLEA